MLLDINTIIEGCIKNDYKSQKELYSRYYSVLLKVCLRYSKSICEAEDVLLTGFYKIFKNIGKYDPSKSSFNSWITRIVVNAAIDNYRKNNKHYDYCAVDDVSNSLELSEIQFTSFDFDLIMKLVNELAEGCRVVFNLYVVEGYTHKEIAKCLGVSESTSKTQLRRARLSLKKKLADNNIENLRANNEE